MWYAAKAPPAKTEQNKKLREARQTLKWMPLLAVVGLVLAVVDIVNYAKHPDTEHLLSLVFPVGFALYLWSHWTTARATLNGTLRPLPGRGLLLGIVLMACGPALKTMWHNKQMDLFWLLGTYILVLTLFCCAMWEWSDSRRAEPLGDNFRT